MNRNEMWRSRAATIKSLCDKYDIEAISIGNGTAGRETETFVKSIGLSHKIVIMMVNESGASVYSASTLHAKSFRIKISL
jgi:uncharacterized protein